MPLRMVTALAIASLIQVAHARQLEGPKVGDKAPPLELEGLLQSTDGVPAPDALGWDYFRGNIVVLEFWATWCGPCIAAIPHLNALADEFKDRPVRFISVTDEAETTIRDFINTTPMSSWIGLDLDQSMYSAYGVQAIPRTVLIDSSGMIAAITHPKDLTADAIEQVLAGRQPDIGSSVPMPRMLEPDGGSPLFQVRITPTQQQLGDFVFDSRGSRYMAEGVTLGEMLAEAWPEFASSPRMVLPEGLDTEARYKVEIDVPSTLKGGYRTVLRQSLMWTFGLTIDIEMRDMRVGVLTLPAGGMLKLEPAPADVRSIGVGPSVFRCEGATLEEMRPTLEKIFGYPIVDNVGLQGPYELAFNWLPEEPGSAENAFEDATGMSLAVEWRPVEVLVIQAVPQ